MCVKSIESRRAGGSRNVPMSDANEIIKETVENNEVVLFMKGTKRASLLASLRELQR